MIKNIKNIYWMMAYAFRSIKEDLKKEKVNSEEFENIYDLLSAMYIQGVKKQIKRGLNKEYVLHAEYTVSIRGKINISESLKTNEIQHKKMLCEYDEYSINSYMNKILKTAGLYLLKSKKIRDKKREKELYSTMLYFSNVDKIDRKSINWNILVFTKNNITYKNLMNIAYLILDGLIITKENGQEEFAEYIDDQKMNKLYEKFILEYFRYHYPEFSPNSSKINWDIKEKEYLLPEMQADVILTNKLNKNELIIDAKYYSRIFQKNVMYDKETIRSGNLYQIYTYVKNRQANKKMNVSGMLLYAKTYEDDIGWEQYNIGENEIIVTYLDLEEDFNLIKKQLNFIANWLKNYN